MRRLLLLPLLLIAAGPAWAEEDEAHRLDRLRTEALNRQAARAVERRDTGNDAARRDYRDARAEYERRMQEWRRRYDACLAGDYAACDRR